MFFLGLLAGMFFGLIVAVIGQREIEKQAEKNGCMKINNNMYEIIPWRKENKE